ncbi:MAG TPA: SLC13 family permease [Bryobacteraceae bacterium]|nr:SLC13 family permease [Bryobacteraceae bacterium]
MSIATLSLVALFGAILLSCFTTINIGVLSIVLAWIVGYYFGGMKIDLITAGFPSSLFLTLVGVTLLFTQAQVNGTLDRVAHRAVRICRGNVGLIPVMFFFVGLGLATMGPGNIAGIALLAPLAMTTAHRARVPAFLMAIMASNGANAGALSPFAPTGVIAASLMGKIGLSGHEWQTWFYNAAAHALVAFAGYFVFGGWKLFRLRYDHAAEPDHAFESKHWATLAVIAALIVSVVVFKVNVGMGALVGALLLPGHIEAIKKMPWGVIVMVTGVTVLVSIMEKTQGIQLFSDMLARLATPHSATAVVAFVVGLISVYASTSGVILPTFLPMVPSLVARIGGGVSALALASSINVGGHLVDVSPLSTIGALCIASAVTTGDSRKLFNQMLAWGLAMSLAGALICYLFFA